MLETLSDVRAPLRRWFRVVIAMSLGGCASTDAEADPVVTLTAATVTPTGSLIVRGRVCDGRPPVQLALVETLETHPVRFVLRAQSIGAPASGCVTFETSLALTTMELIDEGCREGCLIEVRPPKGVGRTIQFRSPGRR